MADIASLGLKIDSSQAASASRDLDKLSAAGKKAETAIDGLQRKAEPGLGAVSAAAKRAGISVEAMRERIAKAGDAADAHARTLTRSSVPAVKSVQAALENLTPAQDKADNAASRLANTLTKRFVLGYAVSQIRNMIGAVAGLNAEMAQTGYLGRLTGIGSGGVQGIAHAAGNQGVAGQDIAKAMAEFNQQIPLAQAGIGTLGQLLRGNRVTITDTSDAFFKISDLIKNAANDTARESMLRQAGLPATRQFVDFMKQGSAELKKQIADAPKFADAQIEAAERLEKKFNTLWMNIATWGKQAAVGIAEAFGQITTPDMNKFGPGSRIDSAFSDTEAMNTKFGQAGTKVTVNKPSRDVATEKAIAADRISKAQQYLGLLGATTTALEARRAVELQLAAAAQNGVGIDAKRAETLKRLAEEQVLGITAMKASADQLRVEAETVGMATGQATAYTAAQTKLNEARRNGQALTADNVASIQREADALGHAAQRTEDIKWSYENLVRGPMQTFRSELRAGKTAMEALRSAGVSALDKIAEKLMDMAAQGLWSAAFGGSGGGLFSLFGLGGSAFGKGGSAGAIYALGGIPSGSSDISRYSNQVVDKPTFFANGGNVMGEAGPEAIMPLTRMPSGKLGVQQAPASGSASAAPAAPSVVINQPMTFNNADPGSEARIRAYVDQSRQRAVSEAVQAVQKAHTSAPGSYLK